MLNMDARRLIISPGKIYQRCLRTSSPTLPNLTWPTGGEGGKGGINTQDTSGLIKCSVSCLMKPGK